MPSYWRWTTGGSKWRLVGGIGGPILAGLFVLGAVFGETEEPSEDLAVSTRELQASATATAQTPENLPAVDPPMATLEPPAPTPVPATYTIQPGDSLSAICASNAPHLTTDSCILQVVQLNALVDPGQIAVGQTLLLPVASTSVSEPLLETPTTGAVLGRHLLGTPLVHLRQMDCREAASRFRMQLVLRGAAPATVESPVRVWRS